jgi:hypothetical protein
MKPVPQDIQDIFLAIKELVQHQIVNEQLAQPIDVNTLPDQTFENAKNALLKKTKVLQDPRVYLARFWLALFTVVMTEMHKEHDLEDSKTILQPIVLFASIVALICFYESKIGALPLQGSVNKLLLPKKEFEQQQKYINHEYARNEAARKSPLSGWGLIFNEKKLEKIFQERKIPVNIHESILIALSSIKYKSFDCVAITALVLLKLIERTVPCTLKWYYKPGNDVDGHNFIIATDNDDNSFITDPWHGVCTDAGQMILDPNFLLSYPLLSTDDKEILVTIKPEDFKYYQGYIDMMNEALPKQIRDLTV